MTTLTVEWSGAAVGVNQWLTINRQRQRLHVRKLYKDFVAMLSLQIAAENPGVRFRGQVTVSYTQVIHPRRDVDSLTKPVLDAIERSGVVPNDVRVRGPLHVTTVDKQRGGADALKIVIADYEPMDAR
jgi:Holliday junction resolvase RusA-like endonuclease